ncbi:MAG: hypothetical protein HFH60_07305 [Lachnospiraceae bacterium]|nr:hypothetical protein [Lachnospiraceae bacterium]
MIVHSGVIVDVPQAQSSQLLYIRMPICVGISVLPLSAEPFGHARKQRCG